ncbi:site-specific DNA-methyltransferase [Blastopirellula sp. JC732]|uniref:Methyltransferase n=1 Tax=Blastopirellula sediminis TaxID=2894196 RepID=A0A9X1MNW5_9BACT|nr:site-specific DNA-methyltransferase [Blastopirellula sediminis]MCC9606988.1 site-specific DNA-methyltransferase [Blastopirellula sediminis]MCC9629717.1 site-specific DNA-methyltransferase [Blastopirellula sediminis]
MPKVALDKLKNEDCIQGMKKLPDGSVDLVFADPPFNIGYKYDVYDDRRSADEYLEWSRGWMEQVVRVLKEDGSFWLAIGDDFAAELKVLATRDLGLHCRNWVVWYYTFGMHCKAKFTRSHTHLFYFVRDPEKFTFNDMSIRVPSARMLVYGDRRANPKGRVPDDTWVLRPQDIPESFQSEEDTWHFPRVAGTFKERAGFHGCQMPEQLLGRIIKVSSSEGETVLDPFAGSGSTLVVAKKLGRRYLGFEMSQEYAAAAQSRIEEVKSGDPLTGSPEPSMSAPSTANGRHVDDVKPKKRTAKKRATAKK